MPIENPYRAGLGGAPSVATSTARPTSARMCTMYTLLRITLYIGGIGIFVLLAIRKLEHNRAEELLSRSDRMRSTNKDHLLLRGVYQERSNEVEIKTNAQEMAIPTDRQRIKQHLIEKNIVDRPSLSELQETNENNVNNTPALTAAPTESPTNKPTVHPTLHPTLHPTQSPTLAPSETSSISKSDSSNSGSNMKHVENSHMEVEMPSSHLTPHENKHDEVTMADHHEGVHEMPLTHATPHDREVMNEKTSSTKIDQLKPPVLSSSSEETVNVKTTVPNPKTPSLGMPQSSSVGINKYDLKIYKENKNNRAPIVMAQSTQPSYTCKDGNNPFKSVPPDAFTPPKETNDEILREWAAAVHEVTTKISRLQVGGQKLREAASKEAQVLDKLRLKLFCPIIDNHPANATNI